jgi:hypothetical protein
MGTCSRTALQLTVLCLAMTAASIAADNGYLYVVHGVPGRDVAATLNPGWPVDISFNDDGCSIKGLVFASTSGPLSLPPGKIEIKISVADTLTPCSNPPLIDTTIGLLAGKNATAVIALNSSGAPSVVTFADNLDTVTAGDGRLIFAHAADAPALQFTVTELGVKDPTTHTYTVNPGKEIMVNLPVGTYAVTTTSGTTTISLGNLSVDNQAVNLVYIVGSAGNDSVGLINRLIRDVL